MTHPAQPSTGLHDPKVVPGTSLILPSRGRPDLLRETVGSILSGEEIPAELIIIDQSPARNEQLAVMETETGSPVRYLWRPSQGASLARNSGIAASLHPILVFTDDDIQVAPDWFGAITRALLASGKKTVVTGQVRAGGTGNSNAIIPSLRVEDKPEIYQGRIDRDVLFTGNMAIYRSAFEEIGNFDQRLGPGAPFPSAEDNDLGYRLLQAGYTILYLPKAIVYHCDWRPEKDLISLNWAYGVGHGAFCAKYFSWRDRFTLKRLVKRLLKRWIRFPRVVLRRSRLQSAADIAYTTGLLFGVLKWFTMRSKAIDPGSTR